MVRGKGRGRNLPNLSLVLDDEHLPLLLTGAGRLHAHHVVRGGEDAFVVEDVLQRGVGRVEVQGGGVERPLEPLRAVDALWPCAQVLEGGVEHVCYVQFEVGLETGERFAEAAGGNGVVVGGGGEGGAILVVADNAGDACSVEVGTAASCDESGAEPVVAVGCLVLGFGCDDDIISLTHGDLNRVCGVRLDWDKILGDNSQVMLINAEVEH